MKPFPLLLAVQLFVLGTTAFAQSGVFSPQLTVFNNLNSTAGSNGISLTTGSTPSLCLIRSVGTWSDTWWQWTMGTDNKLRLGFSTVPQLTFQNGALGIGSDQPRQRLEVGASSNPAINIHDFNTAELTLGINESLSFAQFNTNSGGFRFVTAQDGLSFPGGGNEVARFTASGKVGIGTTAPQAALDIYNGLHVHGLPVYATTGAGLEILKINDSLGTVSMINAPDRTERELRFYGTPLSFFQAGAERMRIASNGNVGIGTISPSAKLTVAKDGAVLTDYALAQIYAAGTTNGNQRLALGYDTTNNVGLIQAYVNGDSVKPLILQSAGGNVGIGTTNPTHKLAVNGTIKAKEVIVETTGWSDYVFAEDYALAPLAEVEAHIKEHKHLPGIPSAAEVADQGVSVGDMQAKLLAKIEELTLHVISQEKRAAVQEARIQALEAEKRALHNVR